MIKKEKESTTVQVKLSTKRKLNVYKNYLMTNFDDIINGFMDLIQKYKLRKDLKDMMDSKKEPKSKNK